MDLETKLIDGQFVMVYRSHPENIIMREVYKAKNGSEQNGVQHTFNVEFIVRKRDVNYLSNGEIIQKVEEDLQQLKERRGSFNLEYFVTLTNGRQSKRYKNGSRLPGIKKIQHPQLLKLLRTLPKYVQNWVEDLNE